MNLSNFTSTLEGNGISTGSVQSFYSFKDFSGGIFFNDLYSKDSFVIGGIGNQVALNLLPLVSLRSGSPLSNTTPNSGYFDKNQVLRIGSGIPMEDWTLFLNLKKNDFTQGNLGAVLFSTQSKPSDSNGFTVGINSSDRMFVEYNASGGDKIIHTHNDRVGDAAVYSFSKQADLFQITKHDFLQGTADFNNYSASGFSNSTDWFLGNFKDFSSLSVSEGYTGYSGYLDDVAIVEGGLTFFQQQKAAQSYIQKSGEAGFKTGYFSGFIETFNTITGATVNLSGVTGTGITGNTAVYLNYNIPTVNNIIVRGFGLSGLTGELFGLSYDYLTGSSITSGTGFVWVEAEENFDSNSIIARAPNAISFTTPPQATDQYEIYSQKSYYDTIGIAPTYISSTNAWYLSDTTSSFKPKLKNDTVYTGGNINVYREGYFINSGTGFSIVEDDELIFQSEVANLAAGQEKVTYDYIYGTQLTLPSDSTFTGSSQIITTTQSKYFNKDIYFSSSGSPDSLKLISGLDWSGVSNSVKIGASSRGEGIYCFAPLASNDFYRATGMADNPIFTNFNLVNEQIWINGIKQIKNKDYIVFSSGENNVGQSLASAKRRTNFSTDSTGTYWNF